MGVDRVNAVLSAWVVQDGTLPWLEVGATVELGLALHCWHRETTPTPGGGAMTLLADRPDPEGVVGALYDIVGRVAWSAPAATGWVLEADDLLLAVNEQVGIRTDAGEGPVSEAEVRSRLPSPPETGAQVAVRGTVTVEFDPFWMTVQGSRPPPDIRRSWQVEGIVLRQRPARTTARAGPDERVVQRQITRMSWADEPASVHASYLLALGRTGGSG